MRTTSRPFYHAGKWRWRNIVHLLVWFSGVSLKQFAVGVNAAWVCVCVCLCDSYVAIVFAHTCSVCMNMICYRWSVISHSYTWRGWWNQSKGSNPCVCVCPTFGPVLLDAFIPLEGHQRLTGGCDWTHQMMNGNRPKQIGTRGGRLCKRTMRWSSEGRRSPDRPLVRRNAWEHWTILRKEIILRFLLCLKNSLPFLVQVLIVVFSVCPHGSSHSSIGSSSMWESFHLVDWAHFSGSTLRWVWNDSVRLTDIVLVCAVQHTQHVFLVQSY